MLVTIFVIVDPGDLLALLQGTCVDADQADATEEGGGVQVGDVSLQRRVDVGLRLRENLEQGVEQWLQVRGIRDVAVARVLGGCLALAAGGVENREVEQLLSGCGGFLILNGGGQLEEQILGFFHNLVDAGIGTVGLVHGDDHRHLGGQCLGQHEAGLWERTFGGINKKDNAVHHGQRTLNLATEVGVAGGVDDVDDQIVTVFALTLASDGGVLGQDGDALFAFQVTGVHHTVCNFAVVAEHTRLLKHAVYECGFSVVNVRDDSYVAKLWMGHCGHSPAG